MEDESMTPGYFESICEHLSAMDDQSRVDLRKMDVGILKAFCLCLETWDYSVDEESMERWRSVITPFKVIWPKDDDFDSITFELEVKIVQSKHQFEGWYRNSIMQCKSLKLSQIIKFIREIRRNLESFSVNRDGKIVPLKKQSDILRGKIEFLEKKMLKVKHCLFGEENLQFMNFVGNFSNSVACLTCLYWAKEDDQEIAYKMEIVLFDMLQKFVSYAFDIIPIFYILKSDPWEPVVSDSFVFAEDVETFVDFFFEHLALVLEDDFLFLRDRLIFLFAFLINSWFEDAYLEGGDLIRSQICAILHQEVYLLLPFDEAKQDFSDKKALFSGCMTRIDIEIAKIKQLNSWITLEVEEMEYKYIVSVHTQLSALEKCGQGVVIEQIRLYKMELRFLRAFLLWLATGDDTDEETKVKLSSMIISFRGIWDVKEDGERLLAHRLHAIRGGSIIDLDPLAFELQGKIQQSKVQTGAWCVNLFQSSFQFKASTSDKILEFLDSILESLNDLVTYKVGENIVLFKKQIESLEEKLMFLKIFLKLAVNCTSYEELEEFKMFVQAFANDAACLTFIYWSKDINAESAYETNCILSRMLQKIKPATPDVARLYFGSLMAIYVQKSDPCLFGQVTFIFVELFLEDLVTHLKDDEFHILQDNIVFLLTFLNDPSNQNAEELIYSRIDAVFWEGLYGLTPFDDTEGGFSKKRLLLSDFIMKIEAINASIRCIYGKFSDSSLYNFPKFISPLFLDFLLQNLRNLKDRMNRDRKYVPFAAYNIIKIEEELISLCPYFNHIFDLQSELKETWLEVVKVLHLAEHVIMSCVSSLFVFDHPFWYHMSYLSIVLDEIKVVKENLEMMKLDNTIKNASCLPSSVGFISELGEQGRPSVINEIVVGFEDEKEKIIRMLTWGSKPLDIVSIVGMGGLGKTTLATKVFSSSMVKRHFDVFAFCSVSLDHNIRSMLLDIIRDIKGVDDLDRDMTIDDLAHKLWKCLSRQKYLIVLDDIWNVNAWNEVKRSFPDDENGSRVMFTTRSHEVAKKCRINCSPHQLRFLYEVESWEILQKKVFGNDISPPYLYEVGKQIAKNCKGLPLAVVVIGGLLARTEKSLSWWSEVAQRLAYYLSDEGCMEILELSYKNLPKILKPCLIYLAAFPKDSLISVKRVIRLWIAEGFIQESKTKSLEDVAQGYFYDLVDRSLIIVSGRSCSGSIKTFRVHDLIHELCQTKCREGNFFLLNHGNASSSSTEPSTNNHYRVSTQNKNDVTSDAGSSPSNSRTLHIFGNYTYYGVREFPLRKFRLVHVLDLGTLTWEGNDENQFTPLIHLRYIDAILVMKPNSIPSSISNLWNITSLTFRLETTMPFCETLWRLKSLRHVKIIGCILKFPDDDKHEAFVIRDQILDKVVSFSNPILSTGKDVKRLLQRLPAVRKLSFLISKSRVYDEESIETIDVDRELESLKLIQSMDSFQSFKLRQYIINFPSTLKTLTLGFFLLSTKTLSAIAELHCLEALKLNYGSFVGERLETEDLVFQNLKFFQLMDLSLVEWNASIESFPCLEQIEIECQQLKELPPCFGEMPTLKRIALQDCSEEAKDSAHRIQEELMELGIQLQVSILNTSC